jgi:hypothetical protein
MERPKKEAIAMSDVQWEQALTQPTFSLSDILREIMEDATAWDAVCRELDPEAPSDAAQWLKEVANLGDDQALFASVPEVLVLLVALHNALGCAVHASTSPFPQYAHRLPCVHCHLGPIRGATGYALAFVDASCPHQKEQGKARRPSMAPL